MFVLHVLIPGRVGGLESVVESLAVGHRRLGLRVMVAAVVDPRVADSPMLERLEAEGVETHRIRISPQRYWVERRQVRELCRRFRPDVVHTHGTRVDILDSGAARALGIPTVTTAHGSSKSKGMMAIYEWVQERFWFRRFDGVVAVSRPLFDQLRGFGVPETRLHLIPNALNSRIDFATRAAARRELGLPAEGCCVGWVGRMEPAKGADVLLDALSALGGRNLVVSFVGDGPDRPALEERLPSLAPTVDVRLHGTVDLAARLLPAFDVFVLSSRTEGTPIVLLEAMAAAVPLVVTQVGGVPDMVCDSEALLVPPEQPDALAEAILASITDPAGARRRAARASQRVQKHFALEAWLDRYAALYRQLCPRMGSA